MDRDKGKQEISLIGRLFTMEAFLLLMGIVSLVSGLITGETMQIFWGVMIFGGAIILHFVRKKDWKKHWEEQERLNERYRQREAERKEKDAAGKR